MFVNNPWGYGLGKVRRNGRILIRIEEEIRNKVHVSVGEQTVRELESQKN